MVHKSFDLSTRVDDDLVRVATECGLSESEIVEQALQRHLKEIRDENDLIADPAEQEAVFEAGAGMWKHRTDLPDFAALRDEWDERLERLFDDE